MTDPVRSLSARVFAVAALICFAPIVFSFFVPIPGAAWARNYPGILFHLAIFLLVAKLEAPEWARAAGYGWILLDVTTGVMTLNGVPHEIYDFVRFGGHIFAGIWFVMASLNGSRLIQVVGVITGVWLGGFSFLTPFVSPLALAPNGLLVLVWLGIIAWQNGSRVHAPALLAPAAAHSTVGL